MLEKCLFFLFLFKDLNAMLASLDLSFLHSSIFKTYALKCQSNSFYSICPIQPV